ncbi:acetyl esterase/lipase [Methylopila jiangsuensis]|nr:hypothetical protein [Methylopila jiangsuensis]MDR6286108.1 acetyl esterase/lipase [Methylopila jiangsuensis]
MKALYALKCPVAVCDTTALSQLCMSTHETVADLIGGLDELAEAKEVVVIGDSGGGYAALMLGLALAEHRPCRPVRAIAFNPPTKIWPPERARKELTYRDLIENASAQSEILGRLEAEGDVSPWLRRAADDPQSDFRGLVLASSRQRRDMAHAERLRGEPGMSVVSFPTCGHGVFGWWLALPPDLGDDELRERILLNLPATRPPEKPDQPGAAEEPAPEAAPSVALIDQELAALKLFQETFPSITSALDWLNDGKGDRCFELPPHLAPPAPPAQAAETASRTS